jgi:hypothetical protein
MSNQHWIYECTNEGCSNQGVQVRVEPERIPGYRPDENGELRIPVFNPEALADGHFLIFPNIRCDGCLDEPRIVIVDGKPVPR